MPRRQKIPEVMIQYLRQNAGKVRPKDMILQTGYTKATLYNYASTLGLSLLSETYVRQREERQSKTDSAVRKYYGKKLAKEIARLVGEPVGYVFSRARVIGLPFGGISTANNESGGRVAYFNYRARENWLI